MGARHVVTALESVSGLKPMRGLRSFEIVGLDVLLDSDLNAWFLEANCGPDLCGNADEDLRTSVCSALQGALALAKRARDEKDSSWLPMPEKVDAAKNGLELDSGDGWWI